MSELWMAYWPIILVGLLIGLAVGILLFRPRQKIRLSDDIPIRPHMAVAATPPRGAGRGIADEAAAAASDVAGHMLGARVHDELPGCSGAPDDLRQLKGVGPKMAAMLNDHGLTRFDQIAGLSAGQIEALDRDLGAFRGRLERDRIVEQAHYLARGDRDGYCARFGALEQSGGG